MEITAIDIARWIEEIINVGDTKIQKLVYICFGFYGGMTKKYLFEDRIEAWRYGPVIPTLYYNIRSGSGFEIVEEGNFIGNPIEKKQLIDCDNDVQRVVQFVCRKYGHLTALKLTELTHEQGTPWAEFYIEGVKNIEIPKDAIVKHYFSFIRPLQYLYESGVFSALAKT